MRFYTRLKDLREDNDLNQIQVAEIIKTSQSYYSQYENGQKMIPMDRLITLAKFYNVSADYILGLTDKKHSYKEWE